MAVFISTKPNHWYTWLSTPDISDICNPNDGTLLFFAEWDLLKSMVLKCGSTKTKLNFYFCFFHQIGQQFICSWL